MLTIFIHGTLPFSPLLKIPSLHTFCFCPPGLNCADNFDQKYHLARLATLLCKAQPDTYLLNRFYFFGWSGQLSARARKLAAQELYSSLKALNYNQTGGIRIITYSHGGNLALNLALIAQEHNDSQLIIEELILLACPVQQETRELVYNPLFKRIYSLHSHKDMIQVLDPQKVHALWTLIKQKSPRILLKETKHIPLFSKRHFPTASHITQAQIKLNGHKLFHVDFLSTAFMSQLPTCISYLEDIRASVNNHEQDIIVSLPLKTGN